MKTIEIKKGIKLHIIETNKFKTNLLSVFITTPINKESATRNALIPAVLKRGTENLKSQDEISKALEEMYGASFNCGIDKIGNNQVIKFYIENINNQYLPEKQDNLKNAINLILDIAFKPCVLNNSFNSEYVESEKNNLKKIIEGRKDSKAQYALERCIEEMYKKDPYSIYKYGNSEDLDSINNENLYEYYRKLIDNAKIDIYVSGEITENIKDVVINNENIKNLVERTPNYIENNIKIRLKKEKKEELVQEKMDITQGKLILGLDILDEKENDKYIALIYNAILGGTPNSKMFQNVREKNSLAYTASSSFLRQKSNIFIKCGIEIENFEKALKLIKEQVNDMKKGKFTENDIAQAKVNTISTIKFIPEEQDTELMYYFSQELSGYETSYEEYIEKINSVSLENVIELANRVQINTIYFLRN